MYWILVVTMVMGSQTSEVQTGSYTNPTQCQRAAVRATTSKATARCVPQGGASERLARR